MVSLTKIAMGTKKERGLKMNFKCFNNSWAPFENFNVFFLTVIHEINKEKKKSKSQPKKNEVKLINSFPNVNATALSPN
jgi:hypothetical protein